MKIGILGGTFNPIHMGHLIMAEEVLQKIGLAKVIFVPTNRPPHKDDGEIIPAAFRLKMLKLAISGNPHFSVSDIEIRRGNLSYTIDTIKELNKIYQGNELNFIIGSDLFKYLNEWKDLKEIITLVKFIVATRPGYPLENLPDYMTTITIRAVDISAFQIRQCIKQNRSFRYLVPEAVWHYILKKRLYK
ncbi:MAG: nicotinate-nucleotide adenylyltransferase [Candidatus Omnitrophota bacterium]|jgi:nicotinate-nucleotide adenylyltransferase